MTNRKIIIFSLLLLLSSCSGLFYHPDREHVQSPKDYHLLYDNVYFNTQDGVLLHGWKIYAKQKNNPKGTIVFFHGNSQNISTHFLHLAWLADKGYDLFVFDYRGYGDSEGEVSQEGTYLDGLAALEETIKWGVERSTKKFIVYGQSLGGIIAAKSLIHFSKQSEFNLIVLDSTFASYKQMAATKLRQSWATWLFSPLGYLLVSDEGSIKKELSTFRIPKLIIHGTYDKIVPFKLGEELHEKIATPKWFWKIDQSRHGDVFVYNKGEYRKKFLDFLANDI